MLEDHKIEILLLAHQLEKSLAGLYEVFVKRYTTNNSLWSYLLHEENGHAEALRKLYQLTYENKSYFDSGTIKPAAIQSVIDYVEEIINSATSGMLSESQALRITYDLESCIFEKDLFTHFKVSAEYSEILRKVIEEDRTHIQMVKNELQMMTGCASS